MKSKNAETGSCGGNRRWLPFEGADNFRDLGGYEGADGRTVKWGSVFRSDSLARLTDRDLEHLARLKLQLVFDLRAVEEQQKYPDRLPAEGRPEVIGLPIWPKAENELEVLVRGGRLWEREQASDLSPDDTRQIMCKFYRSFIVDHTGEYGVLLKRLSSASNRPAVVHCAGGKDRTGVGAALLLRALGVPMEQVIDDYQLTNRLVPLWAKQGEKGDAPPHIHAILRADPDFLLAAFDAIDGRYGSFDGYMNEALGLVGRDQDQLRATLLE